MNPPLVPCVLCVVGGVGVGGSGGVGLYWCWVWWWWFVVVLVRMLVMVMVLVARVHSGVVSFFLPGDFFFFSACDFVYFFWLCLRIYAGVWYILVGPFSHFFFVISRLLSPIITIFPYETQPERSPSPYQAQYVPVLCFPGTTLPGNVI